MVFSISAYLAWVHLAGMKPLCVAGSEGCQAVQSSRYAAILGVPVPMLGLAGTRLTDRGALEGRGGRPPRAAADPGRYALQHLPHLPRALRDWGRLPVVRGERHDHAAAVICAAFRVARLPASL